MAAIGQFNLGSRGSHSDIQNGINTYEELCRSLKKSPRDAAERLKAGLKNVDILQKLITTLDELEGVVHLLPKEINQDDLLFVCGQVFERSKAFKSAFQCYTRAAGNGHARALTSEGMCYLNGVGVDRSKLNAAASFLSAAGKDHVRGQLNYAVMAMNGDGIPQDIEVAKVWLKRAVEGKSSDAQRLLEKLQSEESVAVQYYAQGYRLEREGNFPDALAAYQTAAKHGHPCAYDKIGVLYLLGKIGIQQNKRLAFDNFKKGANAGSVRSMYNLAIMMELGDGVEKDSIGALSWYTKANDGGCKEAEERLSNLERSLNQRKGSTNQLVSTEATYLEDSDDTKERVKLGEKEIYKLVPPSKEDIAMFQEQFRQYPVDDESEIGEVQKIYCPISEAAYMCKLAQLQLRANNPIFKYDWANDKDAELRKKFLKDLKKMALPAKNSNSKDVYEFLGLHATKAEIIPHILAGGFAALGTTDEGWYTPGIYSTQLGYAYNAYGQVEGSGEKGPLIACKVGMFLPYLLLELMKGKRLHPKFDGVAVPVRGVGKAYYPCKEGESPQFWEYVVYEAAQMNPQFLVWMRKKSVPRALGVPELKRSQSKREEKEIRKSKSSKK